MPDLPDRGVVRLKSEHLNCNLASLWNDFERWSTVHKQGLEIGTGHAFWSNFQRDCIDFRCWSRSRKVVYGPLSYWFSMLSMITFDDSERWSESHGPQSRRIGNWFIPVEIYKEISKQNSSMVLEGYAAFTRDAPLAGRNLGRIAEDPMEFHCVFESLEKASSRPGVRLGFYRYR